MTNHEMLEQIVRFADGIDNTGLIERFLSALERGEIRPAHFSNGCWSVDTRVKQGILQAFRLGQKQRVEMGPFTFFDKGNIFPQRFLDDASIRIVPGGTSVRRGAFLGKNVTIMPPSYINIGAYVGDETMIDSHVLIGSCAQIGARVHVSAGAQIGGVLEPVGARPVIIEDGVLVGGNTGIYEGALIGKNAVIGAGVILTKSTKVFDLVNERVIEANGDGLKIPAEAVVVPGSRTVKTDFAKNFGLSIASPLIIKYRDQKTEGKTLLEEALR